LKVSFIVSCFDRPNHLACVLRSLQIQTERNFEVIVTDNGKGNNAKMHEQIVDQLSDSRFRYEHVGFTDCYASANYGAGEAKGEYLCFPSDDGYYGPRFLALMLAARPANLIYSDCVFDGHGRIYAHWDAKPELGCIDKGGFLIKASVFPGFNAVPQGECGADGWMIDQVVAAGASLKKIAGMPWVHN